MAKIDQNNLIVFIKHRFQKFKSRPSKFKETCAQKRERGVPPKMWLLTAIGSCSAKTVADRHRYAVYYNKHL